MRGTASDIFRQFLAQAMRDGGATLYRTMDRRTSEMYGGNMALRISAQQRENLKPDWRSAVRYRGLAYLLQSLRSLSAIENTASALISMSRTKHCRASR